MCAEESHFIPETGCNNFHRARKVPSVSNKKSRLTAETHYSLISFRTADTFSRRAVTHIELIARWYYTVPPLWIAVAMKDRVFFKALRPRFKSSAGGKETIAAFGLFSKGQESSFSFGTIIKHSREAVALPAHIFTLRASFSTDCLHLVASRVILGAHQQY